MNLKNKLRNRLTDLEVGEVSFVDRAAIGEVFSIIKSESSDSTLVNKLNEDISNKINEMTESEFVDTMKIMMKRYNEINKSLQGGKLTMNEEQVKALVTEIVGSTMETVNKNFSAINKSIDEIQKKVTESTSKQPMNDQNQEEDEKKKETEKDNEVKKAVDLINESVKGLSQSILSVTKSVGDVTDKLNKLSDMKLDEAVAGISKRLESIEKQENPSNAMDPGQEKDPVQKNKTVFWKSFVGSNE